MTTHTTENEMKILHEIKSESDIGTFGKQTAAALIYADKITVREPYAQLTDDNSILAFRVTCITNKTVIDQVTADILGNRQDAAWNKVLDFIK